MSIIGAGSGLEPVMMSTFGVVRFREPFLFLFAGREVRLPSRRRALLAWGGGDCLDLFFLRLLLLPIASLLTSGHVSLLWLTIGYHLPKSGEESRKVKADQASSGGDSR